MRDNKLLHKAKKFKNDEFYTLLSDIENELSHYKDHFRGKVVYCNCDDPRISAFFEYFHTRFEDLGLTKLVGSYRGNPNGFGFEYVGRLAPLNPIQFKGDGDFRSPESVELLKASDVVVTNPPFSLFREFVAQLIRHRKKFLIIGNVNAITYKEIFSLIRENRAWLGVHLGRGVSGFVVPDHYDLYGTETRIDPHGNRIVSPNNCLWLTNLDIPKRHEWLVLTKKYRGSENEYPKYDNFDGINVNRTKNIPADYVGCMGVPITFLHKFNPDQFEIVGFRKGRDGKDLSMAGKRPYFRVLIKNKQPQSSL